MEYRGYTIEKFYNKELVPNRIIAQYYRDEKIKIDRMIDIDIIRANNPNTETVEDGLKVFFDFLEEE